MVTSFCSAEGSRVRLALHDTDSFIKFLVFLLYLCYGYPVIRLSGIRLSGIRLSGTRVFYHAIILLISTTSFNAAQHHAATGQLLFITVKCK